MCRAIASLSILSLLLAARPAAADDERPRGIYVPLAPERVFGDDPDEARRLRNVPAYKLFVNRRGGTYTPGPDNSSINRSSIISQTRTIPPLTSLTDDQWDEVMRCSKLMWGPFGITVTDVDPGDEPHIEAVVGGRPQDIGLPSGVGGVAPFPCQVVPRAVVYVFDVWGPNPRPICETVAQEAAHALMLDHKFHCPDPMTYLDGCGDKWFRNLSAACGEYEPRTCACTGQALMNSVQMLASVLGPPEDVPPVAAITAPADGVSVKPGFAVEVDASDNNIVAKVELVVDGKVELTLEKPPWKFTTRRNLPIGARALEVRAHDAAGNVGAAAIGVTVLPECESAAECLDGQACTNHLCVGEMGATCRTHADCGDGLSCGVHEGEQRCTRSCSASNACPSGFGCATAGTSALCWPADGGSGWCALGAPGAGAAGRTLGGLGLLFVLSAAVGLLGRRRR